MVRLTTEAPRTPGSRYGGLHDRPHGKSASTYGSEGDVCAYPGCKVLLSAYNERDTCCCHPVAGKRRERRRKATEKVPAAEAQEPRRAGKGDVEMAAEKRRMASAAKDAIMAALTGEYETAPRIAARAGVNEALAYYHLRRLVECGAAENKLGRGGGYRRRMPLAGPAIDTEDAPAHSAAGAAPEPAPAPPDPPAAPPSDPSSPVGPLAAGTTASGLDVRTFTVDWFASRPAQSEVDVIAAIDSMDEDARERVLSWALAKFPPHGSVVVHCGGIDSSAVADAVLETVCKGAGQ